MVLGARDTIFIKRDKNSYDYEVYILPGRERHQVQWLKYIIGKKGIYKIT